MKKLIFVAFFYLIFQGIFFPVFAMETEDPQFSMFKATAKENTEKIEVLEQELGAITDNAQGRVFIHRASGTQDEESKVTQTVLKLHKLLKRLQALKKENETLLGMNFEEYTKKMTEKKEEKDFLYKWRPQNLSRKFYQIWGEFSELQEEMDFTPFKDKVTLMFEIKRALQGKEDAYAWIAEEQKKLFDKDVQMEGESPVAKVAVKDEEVKEYSALGAKAAQELLRELLSNEVSQLESKEPADSEKLKEKCGKIEYFEEKLRAIAECSLGRGFASISLSMMDEASKETKTFLKLKRILDNFRNLKINYATFLEMRSDKLPKKKTEEDPDKLTPEMLIRKFYQTLGEFSELQEKMNFDSFEDRGKLRREIREALQSEKDAYALLAVKLKKQDEAKSKRAVAKVQNSSVLAAAPQEPFPLFLSGNALQSKNSMFDDNFDSMTRAQLIDELKKYLKSDELVLTLEKRQPEDRGAAIAEELDLGSSMYSCSSLGTSILARSTLPSGDTDLSQKLEALDKSFLSDDRPMIAQTFLNFREEKSGKNLKKYLQNTGHASYNTEIGLKRAFRIEFAYNQRILLALGKIESDFSVDASRIFKSKQDALTKGNTPYIIGFYKTFFAQRVFFLQELLDIFNKGLPNRSLVFYAPENEDEKKGIGVMINIFDNFRTFLHSINDVYLQVNIPEDVKLVIGGLRKKIGEETEFLRTMRQFKDILSGTALAPHILLEPLEKAVLDEKYIQEHSHGYEPIQNYLTRVKRGLTADIGMPI